MATEAIVSVIGGLIGAAVGFGGVKIHKKIKGPIKSTPVQTPSDTVDTSTVILRHAKKKYDVLGVPTNYMDPRNRFVAPLKNFRSHLQFDPEIEAFEKVVQQIDSLVGIYYAVNGKDRGKRTDWDMWAQTAQKFINEQIDEIISYNAHQTVAPSETKRRDLKMYATAIQKTVEDMVEGILRSLMANAFHTQ
jgi:hypothetical protein